MIKHETGSIPDQTEPAGGYSFVLVSSSKVVALLYQETFRHSACILCSVTVSISFVYDCVAATCSSIRVRDTVHLRLCATFFSFCSEKHGRHPAMLLFSNV